jgi:hypothetical protein
VVLAAVLSVAFAGTSVAKKHKSHAHATGTTVHVIEHAITDTEIPVNGADGKGNPLTFVNPIFNATDTKQIGHDEGFRTRLDPQRGIWECLWTTFL